jgi:succinyl-CoA synthetase beta subunit
MARHEEPPEPAPDAPPADVVERWRNRLAIGDTLEEYEAGQLLRDFGFPMNPSVLADNAPDAVSAAADIGYPVVLKTAQPGILHKTDCDGVRLGIGDSDQVEAAWADFAERLGPRVLVSAMLQVTGAEMVLGLVRDEQFGPLVMLGFGGINVETIHDVAYALPPFSRVTARRLVNSLKLRPLLDGLRNRPAVDLESYCAAAERFSVMAAALGDVLDEVDVNPVIVHPGGCVAVDALVVGHAVETAA